MTTATTPTTPLSLLRLLHQRGRLLPLLREAVVEQAILDAASEFGLAVKAAELQTASDAFRRRRGLTTARDTEAWLVSSQLTPLDLQLIVERDTLAEKLRDFLFARDAAARFATNPDRYARVRMRVLVVKSEGEARELVAQVREEGADFAELARRHSLDATTRTAGGDLGVLFRGSLPKPVNEAAFAARPDSVIGPFPGESGFSLFLVELLFPPEFEAAAPLLRAELFNDWVRDRLAAPINLSWLEQPHAAD